MKSFLKTLFFFLLVTQICFAQLELNRSKSESEYPSIKDSNSSFDIDSLITTTMNNYHIPGLAALINTKDDGIIWKNNYGYKNVELSQPVEDSTMFLIASISKTILATAIMQFWEADSFDLDDNINDYLDGFQVHIPYHWNDTITFRMIMTHTASIRDNWNVMNALVVCGDSPISLDTFLINYFTPGGSYYNSALNFNGAKPGTVYEYAQPGICILAYLVEKFSGMTFNQYCREHIFNPLGMNKTSWFLEGMDTTAIATPYIWQGGQYIPYCHQGFPYYPIGQLRTNKIELEHFLSTYMNWGKYNGSSILDSSTVDLILTDQLGYPIPGWGDYQGLIWFDYRFVAGRSLWGHDGSWYGYGTDMVFQKEEEWGVILFANSRLDWSVEVFLLSTLCDYAQDITVVEEINNPISDFYLEQNYPNPFNPSTKIRYSIPQASNVTIKVFDILGNEIETLVNEEKPAGTYEINWYAENLPSGVYFYQLKAGTFVQTKKMLLLK
jgi:CubicO group peptidase (beta-lactamase class C family)